MLAIQLWIVIFISLTMLFIEYFLPDQSQQYWSGRKAALESSIKSIVNEINITIHGWIASIRHGEQLTSDYKLVKLFEFLKEFGKDVVIPDVIWDPVIQG
jgi:hypothetical protein